jgi:anti-sigma factor RsiW
MNCKIAKQQMIFLAEGSLSAGLADAMRSHLAQCPQCSHVFNEIEQSLAVIGKEKKVKVDPWFAGRVEQQMINLQSGNQHGLISLRPVYRLARILPVAASLFIALALGILIGSELNTKLSANQEGGEFPQFFYEDLVAEDIYERSFETFFLTNGDN